MGAGASVGEAAAPFETAEAALAAGKTQEEIDHWVASNGAGGEKPAVAAAPAEAAPAEAAAAEAAPADPMMLLMQLQGVLAQPDGLQKVLGHPSVVEARKTTPVVDEFCTAVEAAGPMAALGFLGRPDAMAALTSILPGVMADIEAEGGETAPAEGKTAPAEGMQRAVWLWNEEITAETIDEIQLSQKYPGLNGKALLMQKGELSEEDREKVNTMLQRVCFMWMQDQVQLEPSSRFIIPEELQKRVPWLWDVKTTAEVLGEEEGLSSPDVASGLDGRALVMQEGEISDGDREKVNGMLGRVSFMWMQDLCQAS